MAALTCGDAGCRKALAPPFLRCSKCKGEAYCNKECQTAAWKKGHKKNCGGHGMRAKAEKLQRAAVAATSALDIPATAKLTPEQDSLLTRLNELNENEEWPGVVALQDEAKALAEEVQGNNRRLAGVIHSVLGLGFEGTGDYEQACKMHEEQMEVGLQIRDWEGVARAYCNLGNCYYKKGDYSQAREMHEQNMVICEEMGNREGVAIALCNIGNCYNSCGDYARASELHEQSRVMCEALGDLQGMARACFNMGNSYYNMGDYARAREVFEKKKAMCEGCGDRAGVASALCNIGNCYHSTGEDEQALEMFEQYKAICEALGNQVGVAKAYCNLGECYYHRGDNVSARQFHVLSKEISEELGDSPGVTRTCGNIAKICLKGGDYAKAISYFTQQYNMANEMESVQDIVMGALGIGVAHRLQVRANVRWSAGGASVLKEHAKSVSACGEDGVREAEKWLQTALHWGNKKARLHLAHLNFDADQEAAALQYLQDYLSSCVERGRGLCAGCYQTRGEYAQMLTCGGCRVARFCSVDHQKMASKSVASGGCLLFGRHSDVCDLLGKWRMHVVKGCGSPEKLRADLLAFLSK